MRNIRRAHNIYRFERSPSIDTIDAVRLKRERLINLVLLIGELSRQVSPLRLSGESQAMKATADHRFPFKVELLAEHASKAAESFPTERFNQKKVASEIQYLLEVVGLVITSASEAAIDEKAKTILKILESIKGFGETRIVAEKIEKRKDGSSIPVNSSLIGILKRFQKPFESETLRRQIVSKFNTETDGKSLREKIAWILDQMLCYEGPNVAEWKNITSDHAEQPYPKKELLELIDAGKWLVLEFSREKAEEMLAWIDGLHKFAARNGRSFVTVVVLADIDEIQTHMRPIWVARFGEAGAIFKRFPEGSSSFTEAITMYDAEMTAIDNKRLERKARRHAKLEKIRASELATT